MLSLSRNWKVLKFRSQYFLVDYIEDSADPIPNGDRFCLPTRMTKTEIYNINMLKKWRVLVRNLFLCHPSRECGKGNFETLSYQRYKYIHINLRAVSVVGSTSMLILIAPSRCYSVVVSRQQIHKMWSLCGFEVVHARDH